MSTLNTILGEVVVRLENWTPTRDPKKPFRYKEDPEDDRNFSFPEAMTISSPMGVSGLPFTCEFKLIFTYLRLNNKQVELKNIVDDFHELFTRLCYYPGSEWSINADIMVIGSEIKIDNMDRFNLEISMRVIYNA